MSGAQWNSSPLSEVGTIVGGGTPSSAVMENFGNDVAWVTPRDLSRNNGRFISAGERGLSASGYATSSAKLLPAGSIVMSSRAPIGLTAIASSALATSQGCRSFVAGPTVDSAFVYYQFQTLLDEFESRATGSTFREISGSALGSVPIRYPDLLRQRDIADFLGTLDDKIDCNRRLAETAGALASSLFVQAGKKSFWSDKTFADIAKVSGGSTPSTRVPTYWDGQINWATPTDVTALQGPYLHKTARTITEAGLAESSKTIHEIGTILMTSRATIGAFAILRKPAAVNQGFIAVNAFDAELQLWLFHEMRERVDEFISLSNGATFLELSRGLFRKLRVRLAEPSVIREFSARANLLHEVARGALQENETLEMLRDEALTGLMDCSLSIKPNLVSSSGSCLAANS